jgi:carbon storage regulator CsrA
VIVLSRKKNESIVIGGGITVTVVEIRPDKVRLAIVAPKEASIHRQEVWAAIHGLPLETDFLTDAASWAACTDPDVMLRRLGAASVLTVRKARLFGVACYRRRWQEDAPPGAVGQNPTGYALAVSRRLIEDAAWDPAEAAAQAGSLRCLFGPPPFRPALRPEWLAFCDGVVAKLAQEVEEQSAFDRLPILGDALEEAGCDDAALLDHCRNAGPHVRGCWVVDLVLGNR